MAEQATGGDQGQQGGDIGAAASQAYGEALEGGASPEEAFEAAGAAAQEVATEMGMPQEEFDQGMEAASGGFEDAMAGGASPAEAFGSAMDAANEATDPGTEMGPPPDGAPTGDMADVSGDMAGVSGDMSGVTGDVSAVTGDVSAVTGDVSGVTGDMTGTAGDVSAVTGDVSGATGDMTGVTGDVSGVTGAMNDVTGDVTAVTGDVSGVTGDMTDVSGEMAGGPAGGEMDGIGAAASQAYGEALEGGASPEEAFDAAGAAAQEVATEM